MKRIKLKPDKQGLGFVDQNIVYDVIAESHEGYWVRNERATFQVRKEYFEVLTEPLKRVRCICNRWGYGDALTAGKVYEVISETFCDYTLLSNNGKLIKASRDKFENVQEEENVSRYYVENMKISSFASQIHTGNTGNVSLGWTTGPTRDIVSEIEQMVISNFNQQEEVKMSNVNKTPRRVVNIRIFDEDKGLPVENSLVYSLTDFVTEDSNEEAFREVLMNLDVASALVEHNEVRTSTVNQEVLERTGNEVYLRPVKLKDLRVEITPA
jgi:hypothetical protein